jgi:hypothetical protein
LEIKKWHHSNREGAFTLSGCGMAIINFSFDSRVQCPFRNESGGCRIEQVICSTVDNCPVEDGNMVLIHKESLKDGASQQMIDAISVH